MAFDRKALNQLLMLNDRQLATVIETLTKEYGLDLSTLGVSMENLGELRDLLKKADDSTLIALMQQLKGRP